MNYDEKQYEILKKYDDHLYTACYAGFVRLTDRNALLELETVYKEKFGESSGLLSGCNRCVMRGLRNLGLKYFQDKKEYENQIIDGGIEPNNKVADNQTVKKKGRKSATNNKTDNDGKDGQNQGV